MNIHQAFRMSALTQQTPRSYVWTPTPLLIRRTPDGPTARMLMRKFLDAKTRRLDGHLVSMHAFASLFIRQIDRELGPALSQWFANKSRLRRILVDSSYRVGWYTQSSQSATFAIANIEMHGSRAVAQSQLCLEFDAPGIGLHLQPQDYNGGVIPDPKKK